jgi:hypothetical protein
VPPGERQALLLLVDADGHQQDCGQDHGESGEHNHGDYGDDEHGRPFPDPPLPDLRLRPGVGH